MAWRVLGTWLLQALAVALLAVALLFIRRKAARLVATGDIPMSLDGWFSPLQRAYFPLPWERPSTAFTLWADSCIYIEPLRRLPFTVLLTCESGASVLMERFDWQLVPQSALEALDLDASHKPGTPLCAAVDDLPWKSLSGAVRDPRTVWAAPHALPRLLELAERDFDPSHSRRAVVFSGTEMPLSSFMGRSHEERMLNLGRLRKYFGVIKVMTKDILLPGVGVAPMGLCWGYMVAHIETWTARSHGDRAFVASHFQSLEALFSLTVRNKSKFILATRSLYASWLEQPSTLRKAQALAPKGLPFGPSNSSTKAIIYAWHSRTGLQVWGASPQAREAGVDMRALDPEDWWSELSKYRFLLNPVGAAIQTSKTIEALVVLTIPVILRAPFKTFDELIELGFPLVLVDHWENITRAKANAWWEQHSPRLESFRRNCLTVDGYWGMFTGAITRCV